MAGAFTKVLSLLWPPDEPTAVRPSDVISHRAEVGHGALIPTQTFADFTGENGTAAAVSVEAILKVIEPELTALRHEVALGDARFDAVMLPMIKRYVGWTHLLPASASHHHARIGGLVSHGLEVATLAARASHIAVMDFDPKFMRDLELRARRKPLWPLAAATAALHHDLGKPLVDLLVSCAQSGELWNPFVEPLTDWAQRLRISHYAIRWRPGPRLDRHEAFSVLLMGRIAGSEVLNELTSYGRDVIEAVVTAAMGMAPDRYGLHQMVAFADSESAKRDRAQHSEFWVEGMTMSDPVVNRLLDVANALLKRRSWVPNTTGHPVLLGEQGLFLLWPQALNSMMRELTQQQRSVGIPNDALEVAEMFVRAGVARPRTTTSGGYSPFWMVQVPKAEPDANGSEDVGEGAADDGRGMNAAFGAFMAGLNSAQNALLIQDPAILLSGVPVVTSARIVLVDGAAAGGAVPGALPQEPDHPASAPVPADGAAAPLQGDPVSNAAPAEPATVATAAKAPSAAPPPAAAAPPVSPVTPVQSAAATTDAPLDEPAAATDAAAPSADPMQSFDHAGALGTVLRKLVEACAAGNLEPNEYLSQRRNGVVLVRWPHAAKAVQVEMQDIAQQLRTEPGVLATTFEGRPIEPRAFPCTIRGNSWNVIALNATLSAAVISLLSTRVKS